METLDYFRSLAIFCAGITASAICRVAYDNIKNWLKQRKEKRVLTRKQLEDYERKWDEYTLALRTKISALENDLRDAKHKELGYLDERKVSGERIKFLARELACDPDKKTQVMRK